MSKSLPNSIQRLPYAYLAYWSRIIRLKVLTFKICYPLEKPELVIKHFLSKIKRKHWWWKIFWAQLIVIFQSSLKIPLEKKKSRSEGGRKFKGTWIFLVFRAILSFSTNRGTKMDVKNGSNVPWNKKRQIQDKNE